MKFTYKAQTKNKTLTEGTLDARDKFVAAQELREQGLIPLSINPVFERGFLSLDISLFSGVSLSEKIIFTNNLSGMLSAGISLVRALSVLEKQSSNKAFQVIMRGISEDINQGGTFSGAMAKFPKVFSGLFVSMVRAGEESGSLPSVLSEVGLNLKKSYELNKKIKSALMYPSIILGAIILIGILMMMFVVPTLTQTFKDLGSELPASTKAIIWFSDAISQHSIIFFAVLFGFIGAIIALSRLPLFQKYFDFIILRLPVIGDIVKEINSARTARTLASLLSSGVDMSKALTITSDVLQNSYYKELTQNAITRIEKGISLSESFKERTDLYPVMVGEMVEVGEETGNLSKMLLDIAVFYESEVDNKTKDLSTIIEPVLMVIIGGAVGFFAISMISPIYSVMDTIK
ncbi:MAG: type II secretion system F family protein [Candidatus Paceibacterota bacterium]